MHILQPEREISPVPLSIATLDQECLRLTSSKSDLSYILKKECASKSVTHQTCNIIDDIAAVQFLGNTTGAKSLGECSDNLTSFVEPHFSDKSTRVDVGFDRYLPKSIKVVTRAKRKSRGNLSKGIIRRDERETIW